MNKTTYKINKHAALYLIGLLIFLFNLFFFKVEPLFLLTVALSGYEVIWEGVEHTIKDSRKAGNFQPNIHLLMLLATLGSIIIGSFEEAALLILIFSGAHFLEEYAENRSKKAISQLMELKPQEARKLCAGGKIENVPVEELEVGDRVDVLNGMQIPADGIVLKGISTVDEAAITGESMPQDKEPGSPVYASTLNGNGQLIIEVSKANQDALFSKILEIVRQAQENLTPTASKIQRLEPIYVKLVLLLLPLVYLIFFWLTDRDGLESLMRTMIFLVSASPCALAASSIPANLSALSNLAGQGILFKGASSLAKLSDISMIAFDKTGTLTEGKPKLTELYFIDEPIDQEAMIERITAMEAQSNHPLARAFLAAYPAKPELDLEVENQLGSGLVATEAGDDYALIASNRWTPDNPELIKEQEKLARAGKTTVYFLKNDKVLAILAFMDVAKAEAKAALDYFKAQNIKRLMITGDNPLTARAVARELQLDQVFAGNLPTEKAELIKELRAAGASVAMVGDGVNDAPALSQANLSVAMGEGSDVAMEVADSVLMKNDLSKLAFAHQLSLFLNKVVWQNIIFALLVVLFLVSLNFIGSSDMTLSVLAHEGSTLLVIANGLRLLFPKKLV